MPKLIALSLATIILAGSCSGIFDSSNVLASGNSVQMEVAFPSATRDLSGTAVDSVEVRFVPTATPGSPTTGTLTTSDGGVTYTGSISVSSAAGEYVIAARGLDGTTPIYAGSMISTLDIDGTDTVSISLAAFDSITGDGTKDSDWTGTAGITDIEDDSNSTDGASGNALAGVDLSGVSVTNDDTNLYVLVEYFQADYYQPNSLFFDLLADTDGFDNFDASADWSNGGWGDQNLTFPSGDSVEYHIIDNTYYTTDRYYQLNYHDFSTGTASEGWGTGVLTTAHTNGGISAYWSDAQGSIREYVIPLSSLGSPSFGDIIKITSTISRDDGGMKLEDVVGVGPVQYDVDYALTTASILEYVVK